MATVIIKRLAPSPFALITVLVTLAAFFFSSRFPFKPINTSPQQQELVSLSLSLSLFSWDFLGAQIDARLNLIISISLSLFGSTKLRILFLGMERIEATRELHIVHITMSFWLRMKSKKKRKEYRVEAKAARGTRLVEKQKKEEVKPHSCNSRWKQGKGGEVWCNDGFPRLVQRPQEIALTEKMIACFKEDQVSHPRLEVYEGCDHLAEKCRV
ncbi:hypothetical protein POTOM_022429 [Populus tomentosa]|uniref:Uncharacterized protein n=1 Tax=Populus tomentosa TaxID=118781 RepID=A0A8X7ZGN0_POPTO|nr:hypothetical protein POTOM_022429 [Populus tomentosa]